MTDDGCTPSKTWSTSLPPKRCEGLFQSCIESVYVNEFDCLRNVSHIWLRTTLSDFQQALKDKYLTYVSDLNYFGNDALQIWISDQGYTSDRYDSKQTASFSLPISRYQRRDKAIFCRIVLVIKSMECDVYCENGAPGG